MWAPLLRGIEYEIDGLKLSFSATDNSPAIALGHPANQSGIGGTVSGGGTATEPNEIGNAFGSIGDDRGNVAGTASTIDGGVSNFARLIGTVGGGFSDAATALAATTPGGRDNSASGNYSFAAGRRAKANDSGAFVWADSINEDFTSTNSDQYLIRAIGGTVISGGTGAANDPGNAQLYVDGLTRVRHLEFDMLATRKSPLHHAGCTSGGLRLQWTPQRRDSTSGEGF